MPASNVLFSMRRIPFHLAQEYGQAEHEVAINRTEGHSRASFAFLSELTKNIKTFRAGLVKFITPKDYKFIKQSTKIKPAPGHELNPAAGFRTSHSKVATGTLRGAELTGR